MPYAFLISSHNKSEDASKRFVELTSYGLSPYIIVEDDKFIIMVGAYQSINYANPLIKQLKELRIDHRLIRR